MRKIITFMLFLNIILLGLFCGENEEDIQSRNDLSVTLTNINTIYQGFNNIRQEEDKLSESEVENFYSRFEARLREVEMDLAKQKVSTKFKPVHRLSNRMISESNAFFDNRKSLKLNLINISDNMTDYQNYKEIVEKDTSEIKDSLATESIIKANKEVENFSSNKLKHTEFYTEQYTILNRLRLLADSINIVAKKLQFSDTLSVIPVLTDANNIMISQHKDIISVELQKIGDDEDEVADLEELMPKPKIRGKPQKVEYQVTGEGHAKIVYIAHRGTRTIDRVKLPWSLSFEAGKGKRLYVAASNIDNAWWITAYVYVNGKEIKKNMNYGKNADVEIDMEL